MNKLKKLTQELEDRFNRWEHLKKHGSQDPLWADGCNMNLVRNHIIYSKKDIEELCEREGLELPAVYFRETPPEVDSDYMARAGEIRKKAKKALHEYKTNKNYQYLLNAIDKLNKRQIEQTSINYVIGYCKGLEQAIENDNLVTMRRHEQYERYIESFSDCRARVEAILKEEPKKGQISLFEMM